MSFCYSRLGESFSLRQKLLVWAKNLSLMREQQIPTCAHACETNNQCKNNTPFNANINPTHNTHTRVKTSKSLRKWL